MTLDPIAALRSLLAAATQKQTACPRLPWFAQDDIGGMKEILSAETHPDGLNVGVADDLRPADAALICAAVNALPALLAVYEAACAIRDVKFETEIKLDANGCDVWTLNREDVARFKALAVAVDAARKAEGT